jgi:arylsulfatase A-like enzyme
MGKTRRTTRREFLGAVAGAAVGAGLACTTRTRPISAGKRPPNFIFIFTDDQGYGDLSCFGSTTIKTPNIDQMAAEGARFTDFYVCGCVCTPSRAGLMTGRYQIRSGLTRVLFPRDNVGLSAKEMTIADGLKKRGYATACIGKWHLGHLPPFLPTRHGFDYYFGIPYSNDMNPADIYRNEKVLIPKVDQSKLTELYTEEALKFIRQSRNQPFFLYLPHNMPHVPLHISERFKGKSAGGLYGDVIECIDWSTGQILDALRQLGLDENTLVMFTSDNGPWLVKKEHGGSAGPLREGKGTMYDGGVREPFVARWPGTIPPGTVCREPAITLDMLPTFWGLAGAELPKDRPIDGKDILPLLRGQGKSPHDILYFYQDTALRAVRMGNWKYHRPRQQQKAKKGVQQATPGQLYDLSTDIGEKNNVAGEHLDVVKRIEERIAAWLAEVKPGEPGKVET